MPNIPVVSARKLIKVLKKKGYILDRGIILSIIKEAGITVEEFKRLV